MSLRVSDEPALWVALINALIMLGVGFGHLGLTVEQATLVCTALTAIGGVLTRSQVTPWRRDADNDPPRP